MKYITSFFITLFLTALLLTAPAQASGIRSDQNCSLMIQYMEQEQVFSGETVALYRVAIPTDDWQYITIDDFAAYPAALERLQDNSLWNLVADELFAYIEEYRLEPTITAVIDRDGFARFHALQPGLYLIGSVSAENEQYACRFRPQLIALPIDANGQLLYAAVIAAEVDAFSAQTEIPQTGERELASLWSMTLGSLGLALICYSSLLRQKGL